MRKTIKCLFAYVCVLMLLLSSACSNGGVQSGNAANGAAPGNSAAATEVPGNTAIPSGTAGPSETPGATVSPGTPDASGTAVADTSGCYEGMTRINAESASLSVTKNGLTCAFDPATGLLKRIENGDMALDLKGIFIDTGFDGKNILNQTAYSSFSTLNTWDLPRIVPRNKDLPADYKINGLYEDKNSVKIEAQCGNAVWVATYDFSPAALKVSVELYSLRSGSTVINGVSFICKGIKPADESTAFEFPGNTPAQVYRLADFPSSVIQCTDYCNPVVSFSQTDRNFNVLFIDQDEKWGSGVYKDPEGNANIVNLAGVEAVLERGGKLYCGDLYIQLAGKKDQYTMVRDLYSENGWVAPTNGVTDGPIYSCHPDGTMDSGFSSPHTLTEFAVHMKTVADIGFRNVWLLPVFQHPGAEVYEAEDQSIIDQRYGGTEGAIAFTKAANALGMHVMFDYVPHGPRPTAPLAAQNPSWCSKKPDGSNQIEWECVSFDYNNPGYLKYTYDLVLQQAKDIGIEGARIDCAMGGLSNWSPVDGNRASNSGLKAGVAITKAIRNGFLDAGKTPVVLPENFHPVPFYAPYTDIFYDMPLYRTIYNLRNRNVDETKFATELAHWLSVEHQTSPEGQIKLRFLDNHDTVSWTWDSARPVTIYGQEKAQALWALLGLIDGVPLVYQGDEDPSWYGGDTENLTGFFKDLYGARAEYLGNDYDIEYQLNQSPVIAFTRTNGNVERLVLVSLSAEKRSFDIGEGKNELLFSKGVKLSSDIASIDPYGYAIIDK